MNYYDTHEYIKEMVSRGDLRIVVDEGQIVLQVVDAFEADDGSVGTTSGDGIGTSEVLQNAQYSENNLERGHKQ